MEENDTLVVLFLLVIGLAGWFLFLGKVNKIEGKSKRLSPFMIIFLLFLIFFLVRSFIFMRFVN